ncbi:MAG: helix-turn-helix transcriptional regulator [Nanoarchaeota archaeon]
MADYGFGLDKKEIMVEALEEGKIVRVSESYARREGLLVLRKEHQINPNVTKPETQGGFVTRNERKGLLRFEEFRRPLKGANNVTNELVQNFQWVINQRRRERNITRKQLAAGAGISEYELKMIETGILLNDDFVLISKIEKFLGISLRKDGKDYNKSALQALKENPMGSRGRMRIEGTHRVEETKVEKKGENSEEFSGEEIELDENREDN